MTDQVDHITAVPERSRRIEFDGPHNFRDLGGYPTSDGGTTRWGVLFRADRLDQMTPDDLSRFAELGISAVYDLRHDYEREREPDPIPSIHVPVMARVLDSGDQPDFSTVVSADHGVRFMHDMQMRLLEHAPDELARVVTAFADASNLPAVFHCTAGKDRTGLVAALVLAAVGVDRETIIDDFALSSRYRGALEDSSGFKSMLERGVAPEAAAAALGAPPEMMRDVLDEIDVRWGGVDAYLTGPAGIGPATLDALRANLVD